MKLVNWLVLGVLLAGLGCGSGGGGPSAQDIQRFCDSTCARQATCDLLGGRTEAECVSTCVEQGTASANDSCSPAAAEVNACVSAIDALSCPDLMMGDFPEECDLCPDSPDAPEADAAPSAGAGCLDLATCCAMLTGDPQTSCQSVVTNGDENVCAQVLGVYVDSNMCG